jgi:glycosyltransferase involved in cell wall biosynthesis
MITVICVVYNGEKYINQAIDSVLQQTYTNFEILVVDDGSSDSTISCLYKYTNLPNFRLIKRLHTGNPGKLRNDAVKSVAGELIAFIDADDVWYPEKLETQLYFFPAYDMVCSNAERIVEDNIVFDSLTSHYGNLLFKKSKRDYASVAFTGLQQDIDLSLPILLAMNYVITSSVVIKKETLKTSGYFEENLGYRGEDYLLWLEVSKKNKIKFINRNLVKYRIHSDNLSMVSYNERRNNLERSILIRSVYLKDRDSITNSAAKEGLMFLYNELTKLSLSNKDYKKALKYWFLYFKYIKKYPTKSFVKYLILLVWLLLLSVFYGDRNKDE